MSLVVLNGGVTGTLFTQADVDLTAIEVVNDSSPQLGGTLDTNSNAIFNSSAGGNIEVKLKDAGNTLATALFVESDDYVLTDDSTGYGRYVRLPDRGIKIGRANLEWSFTGNTPDNGEQDYETNGLIIEPTGNTWPSVNLFSYGQAAGKNPLYDRLGAASIQEFSNATINLNAANGTVASPTALGNGKRLGTIGWLAYDGNNFGGANVAASAIINVQAIEDAATDNDRACEMRFEMMPEGGDGTLESTDRTRVLTLKESELTLGTTMFVDGNNILVSDVENNGNQFTTEIEPTTSAHQRFIVKGKSNPSAQRFAETFYYQDHSDHSGSATTGMGSMGFKYNTSGERTAHIRVFNDDFSENWTVLQAQPDNSISLKVANDLNDDYSLRIVKESSAKGGQYTKIAGEFYVEPELDSADTEFLGLQLKPTIPSGTLIPDNFETRMTLRVRGEETVGGAQNNIDLCSFRGVYDTNGNHEARMDRVGGVSITADGNRGRCEGGPFQLEDYTVATLPTTGISQGSLAYVTDESSVTGGKCVVFYDGSNWKLMHAPTTTAS